MLLVFSKKRILAIVPHRDDAVLGFGGILMKYKDSADFMLLYFNTVHPNIKQEIYDAEFYKIQETAGFGWSVSQLTGVNRLQQIPIVDFIAEIESWINIHEPATLLAPFPSYNQDHRHLYEAAITASRVHDENFYVKNVLLYEQPETLHSNRVGVQFVPQHFESINIKQKSALYELYESQLRGHRTVSHVENLAAVRGMQCDKPYAESFMVVRSTT